MIGWLLLFSALGADIRVDPAPVQGEDTVVVVTDPDGRPLPGETVRVVHRPNLDGERELAIGISDGFGRVAWTPEQAGVTRLRAGDSVIGLRVGWANLPSTTFTVGALGLLLSLLSLAFGLGLLPAGRLGPRKNT